MRISPPSRVVARPVRGRRQCVDDRHAQGGGGPAWLGTLGLPHLWVDVEGRVGGPLAALTLTPRRRKSSLRRTLGELPLQRSPVHAERLRRFGDVASSLGQNLLDVLPLDARDGRRRRR